MKILSIYKSIGVVALAATLLVSCSELEFDIPVETEVSFNKWFCRFLKLCSCWSFIHCRSFRWNDCLLLTSKRILGLIH